MNGVTTNSPVLGGTAPGTPVTATPPQGSVHLLASYRLDLYIDPLTPLWESPAHGLNAALTDLVREVDPALAARIAIAQDKPFTLTPLYRIRTGSPVLGVAGPRERAWVRLGLLDRAIQEPLLEQLLARRSSGQGLRLYQAAATIEGITPVAPWGALLPAATYHQLYAAARPVEEIALRFVSPTVTRTQDRAKLGASPRNIFGSYLRRWCAFAPAGLITIREDAFDAISVSSARLEEGPPVTFRKFRQTGSFIGTMRYHIPEDASFRQAVSALADYAHYAGTGARTALGLGETERLS